jgi:hypothetical protein
MNPGIFSVKEHVLIAIIASAGGMSFSVFDCIFAN